MSATLRQQPLEVAPDTFLVRANQHSLGGSVSTSMNSLVIRAVEPVVVDTGMVTDRATFFEDVFSLVEPDDVRWIFLTHDDDDHSGNLIEALERCPNAMVVMSLGGRSVAPAPRSGSRTNGFAPSTTVRAWMSATARCRPCVRPSSTTPTRVACSTRRPRVYFAADAFCAPMPAEPVDRVDQMPEQMWAEGFALFHHNSLCPWITLVDAAKYEVEVAKLAAIGAEVITSAHGPTITSASLDRAFDLLAGLPTAVTPPLSNASGEQVARHAGTGRR